MPDFMPGLTPRDWQIINELDSGAEDLPPLLDRASIAAD
jgi:hypothetical protein